MPPKKAKLLEEFAALKIWIESPSSADSNITDNNRITHDLTIEKRDATEINFLLNIKPKNSSDLLSTAQAKNRQKVTQYLLVAAANSDYENEYGQTALSLACEYDNIEAVKIICESKSELINKSCAAKYSPLTYALIKENIEIAKYLLRQDNIDLTTKNINDSFNCFEIASRKSNTNTKLGQEFQELTQNIILRSIALDQYKELINATDYTKEEAKKHRTSNSPEANSAQQLSKRQKII